MKTVLQQTIEQIGEDAVQKSIPVGAKISMCMVHGKYLTLAGSEPCCPLCPKPNGETATAVEHYINVREAVGIDGTNPQQKL